MRDLFWFLLWAVIRSAVFVTITMLALDDWSIGVALSVVCTLIHAETIYEGRRDDRERFGRYTR